MKRSRPGRRPRARLAGFFPALAAALPLPAAADFAEPFYSKNLSPVAGLLGLPAQRSADTGARGSLALALHSSVANHYVLDSSADEFVNLDGETVRLALDLRYGLARDWELQLELPWVDHSGGNLDRVIDDWHDFWGMSDGGRSDVARDLLDYTYANPRQSFSLRDDASGIGDTTVALSWAVHRREGAVASLALGYKFGTGDEDDFLGSGGDDAYLALRFSGSDLSGLPLDWHGQLGYLRAGDSDLMGDAQERDLWFAGLAADWRLGPRWSLIGQLDSHAAPLDSDLTAVGDVAYLLTVGARWRPAAAWAVDFNVIEDIRVETAPDVTFQLSLRYRAAP